MPIQFKRNVTNTAKRPASLLPGEQAFDIPSRKIYVGNAASQPVEMGVPTVAGMLEISSVGNDTILSGQGLMHPVAANQNNVIGTGGNLNNYFTSGLFRVQTNANQGALNRPIVRTDRATYGYLHIVTYPANSVVQQIYYPSTEGRNAAHPASWYAIYVRFRINNAWTEWLGTGLQPVPNISTTIFGPGTRWVDVTGSRSPNVTYTNNRSYPIEVAMSIRSPERRHSYVYLNGNVLYQFGNGDWHNDYPTSMIVPPGATYSTNAAVMRWCELV